jgi:hypothetical protein
MWPHLSQWDPKQDFLKEVVKRSGRDKPMWVVIHMCMEAMLGISLYSYLYQTSKMLCLPYYLLCFLFNKIREQEGRTGSAWKWGWGRGWGKVTQTMYIHVSKCKNDKIKEKQTAWFREVFLFIESVPFSLDLIMLWKSYSADFMSHDYLG